MLDAMVGKGFEPEVVLRTLQSLLTGIPYDQLPEAELLAMQGEDGFEVTCDGAGVVGPAGAALLRDGDALSDLATPHDQPELFGSVAWTATAWRMVERIAGDELGLAGLRATRAQARERAWRVGARPQADLLLVDVRIRLACRRERLVDP